ncbi:MAG: CPBP family intramembrane glutamic endopeptidase [Pseudomonadota bacterium]
MQRASPPMRPSLSTPVQLTLVLLVFLLPGLAIRWAVFQMVPQLVEGGVPILHAWTLAVVGPTALGAVVTLSLYWAVARPTWAKFRARFRLHRPKPLHIALVPIALVAIIAGNFALSWTVPWLTTDLGVALPPVQPEIFADVYQELGTTAGEPTFMGQQIAGQRVFLALYWLVLWCGVAVVAEEVMWRGFALPVLERAMGWLGWVVNGLLWCLPFHLYTLHTTISDLPLYLIVPFCAFLTGSTWVSIAIHAALVGLALLLLI